LEQSRLDELNEQDHNGSRCIHAESSESPDGRSRLGYSIIHAAWLDAALSLSLPGWNGQGPPWHLGNAKFFLLFDQLLCRPEGGKILLPRKQKEGTRQSIVLSR
jgi:hypothetical protein